MFIFYNSTRVCSLCDHKVILFVIYNCELCDLKAKRKSPFLQHVQYLHKGISYNCEYCDYKTKWECSLFQHVQSVC